jgi:multidrug resistance efflux pump
MKRLVLFCSTILAAGFASWQYFSADRNGESSSTSGPTESTTSESAEMLGIGYVEPLSEVRQLMMRTGGVVKRCYVHVGDFVRKGEPILELEGATQQAEVEVARKELELARAEADYVKAGVNPYRIKVIEQTTRRLKEKLDFSRRQALRYQTMISSLAASRQEYESMNTQWRQTEGELKEQEAELDHLKHYVMPEQKAMQEAKVRHAQAKLESAQEKLQETKLLAPFDGTVLKLVKREGEGVRSMEPETVVLFGDMSRVRIRAEMDERFVTHLQVGQAATIYGRNLAGKRYHGQIGCLEHIMGKKTAFTRASSERKDLEVLQVLIDLGPDFTAPAGLQVDVKIECPGSLEYNRDR